MSPHCSWRALASLLALAASIACGARQPASAQDAGRPGGGLAYEIELDLSLNPAGTEEPARPSATARSDVPHALNALVPGDGEPRTRVVHGITAESGQWPSAVSLDILKEGATTGALCAGTVIDPHWILTAAHCVFDRFRGGVKSVRAVTAYARSTAPHQGELRRVRSVVAHPLFAVLPRPGRLLPGLVNDIALLELEAPTSVPRQKLLASAAAPTALAAGAMATVVGWGLTTPRKPDERADLSQLSRALLSADVPVVDRRTCKAFLAFPGNVPTEPLFCAGDGKGGADACNGDSGGPIFVAGHVAGQAGEPLQAGVISWGEGCARPDAYGAYTALPHFEAWIRERVPQAQWSLPGEAAPALALGGHAAPQRPTSGLADATAAGRVRLRILGMAATEQRRVMASLDAAALAGEGEAAALIWDARRQLILNDRGHRIAEGVEADGLQHAVDRRQALDRLVAMAAGSAVTVRIRLRDEPADAPPDATHKAGAILYVDVGGIADGAYVAVFNFTGNGKVELIAPAPAQERCDGADCGRGVRKAEGASIGPFEVRVRAPYGAEHVVAVAGTRPLNRLMPALAEAHGKLAVAEVMAALASELKAQPLQAGFRGIYSARK
jgi:secreted trypsin-like serine protease